MGSKRQSGYSYSRKLKVVEMHTQSPDWKPVFIVPINIEVVQQEGP
jgi:hypothetical protein